MALKHFLGSRELDLASAYSKPVLLFDGLVMEENFVTLFTHGPNLRQERPATGLEPLPPSPVTTEWDALLDPTRAKERVLRLRKGTMLDATSIAMVLEVYRPERSTLTSLLGGLVPEEWERPTECPAYTVKGVATHILGDDLSLLSRQRDRAENGLSILSAEMPSSDFRTLLDTFNDRWVAATGFLSPNLLIGLLGLTGEWTADYYENVDPLTDGEPVGLFGARQNESSPFWQAIAREYVERWIHHSQIRRALGLSSLSDRKFLVPGLEVLGAIARLDPKVPPGPDTTWSIGPIALGSAEQATAILTRAHTPDEVCELASGPPEVVQLFAAAIGRP
jgi:uncharacterized protein (TIGR03083 family)